jgi:predicted PurR-regulated permease PerM
MSGKVPYGEPLDDGGDDESKMDFGSIFPKRGDSRRPPEWLGRALLMVVIAAFIGIYVWLSWGGIAWIVLDVVVCIFLALAMEPVIAFLIRHGWSRGAAAGVTWVSLIIIVVAIFSVFGGLFVSQIVGLIKQLPTLYDSVSDFVSQNLNLTLPDIGNLSTTLLQYFQSSWITDFAGKAISTITTVGSYFMSLMIIVVVTYYIAASGPRMRQSICRLLNPKSQHRFLVTWTVAQGQISSFLNSRIILAVISTIVNSVYLACTGVSYWLPLALFYALISQFIPMVGSFIGAIMPVIVVWTTQGFGRAVILVIFIIVYQQIENMILAPKIQQKTMSVNPALGLLAVFFFGALFGPLGMFLALPITASIQVLIRVYTRRYDLVESPLLGDPVYEKKSKVVRVGHAISDHILRPVTERLPRAARGSTARVVLADVEEDLKKLHIIPSSSDLDASETVAIPTAQELDSSITVAIPKGSIRVKPSAASDAGKTPLEKLKGMPSQAQKPAAVPPAEGKSRKSQRSLWKSDDPSSDGSSPDSTQADVDAAEADEDGQDSETGEA